MTRTSLLIVAILISTAFTRVEASDLVLSIRKPSPIALPGKTFKDAKKAQSIMAKISKLQAKIKELSKDRSANRDAIMGLYREMGPLQREQMTLCRSGNGVSLTVVLKNTGKTDVSFNYGGDTSRWLLKVVGKGAVDVAFSGPMTMEYRMGKQVAIAAGKSMEFTIADLKYGSRNMSRWLLADPGKYQISATLKARSVDISSKPVDLTVTSK